MSAPNLNETNENLSGASPTSAVLNDDSFSLYRLPSGVEVYTRRLANGQTAENYYCPKCYANGRTSPLEFRFGGGGNHICQRCKSVYPNTLQAVPAPQILQVSSVWSEQNSAASAPPPPPPQASSQQSAQVTQKQQVTPVLNKPANERLGIAAAPPAWHVNRTPNAEIQEIIQYTPTQLRIRRWLANFGQGGFLASVFIHTLLIIALLTIVISIQPEVKPEETVWTPVGSGGKKGNRETRIELKKAIRDISQNKPARIALNRASSVSLSELSGIKDSLLAPKDTLKGSGTDLVGDGNSSGMPGMNKGFLASFNVMGLEISARNLAVYLDNSGSMVPYLATVKKEILSKFPNADIYEHDAIRITINNGKVENGYRPEKSAFSTANKLLSRDEILDIYGANFNNGSVGAWVDIMLRQGYDALIVFSDFEDGVEQIDDRRGRIFVDTPFEREDKRNKVDKSWEEEWLNLCRTASNTRSPSRTRLRTSTGVRFYLFSIKEKPQKIWMDCVKESRGAYKFMPQLRIENTNR